jgi:hypothetical protein
MTWSAHAMKKTIALRPRSLLSLAVIAALTGCGSDSGNDSGSLQVTAIDGYLSNALVWLDVDGDNLPGATEPQARTGEDGQATLDVSGINQVSQYRVMVQAIAGETQDVGDGTGTPQPVDRTFSLSAPAGQTTITPLTTLVEQQLQQQADGDLATAMAAVASKLGLTEEQLLVDFISQGDKEAQLYALNVVTLLPEVLEQTQGATLLAESQTLGAALAGYLAENPLDDTTQLEDIQVHTGENGQLVVLKDRDDDGVADAEDAFPDDANESKDSDLDGVGDHADAFPLDASESKDSDLDGVGDNSDAFPADKSESLDSDQDGVGDNADAFDDDATESKDSDQDGVGDNGDAYPADPSKAQADLIEAINEERLLLQDYLGDSRLVHEEGSRTTQYLLDGSTIISEEFVSYDWDAEQQSYVLLDGERSLQQKYQRRRVVAADGSFTELSHWEKDYNRDNQLLQEGQVFTSGVVSAGGEEAWSYFDETDPKVEGIDDGVDRSHREYDGRDLAAAVQVGDYADVDFIHHLITKVGVAGGSSQYCRWAGELAGDKHNCFIEYQWADMQDFDKQSSEPNYAQLDIERQLSDGGKLSILLRDWAADGSYNQQFQSESHPDGRKIERVAKAVWANPWDDEFEEYADYTFNGQERGSYWSEAAVTESVVDGQAVTRTQGYRYVLDDTAGYKLVDETHPDGLLMQQYDVLDTRVSDTESTEATSWNHYHLDGYANTVAADDMGQDYKIYLKQGNDFWVGHRFAEWGSRNVVDLAGKVEALRHSGAALDAIDETQLPGLSDYDGGLLTASFRYQADGTPRTWYWVTNWPTVTGDENWGVWRKLKVQLVNGGLDEAGLPGWIINDAPGAIMMLQPLVEEPWAWFNAYQQYTLSIWKPNGDYIDGTAGAFQNWMGSFYQSETQADARLAEMTVQP